MQGYSLRSMSIYGLDYNKSLNIIAGGYNNTISLWNGKDGNIILEKLNATNA